MLRLSCPAWLASSVKQARPNETRYSNQELDASVDRIRDCSDSRLKGMCAQCGTWLHSKNRSSDHVPSRCLLLESEGPENDEYPADLPVLPTCLDCNRHFSKDEEYVFLFLLSVLVGSTQPEHHEIPNVRRALEHQVGLRAEIERSKTHEALDGGTNLVWKPDHRRIERVAPQERPRSRIL